jgi:hypothetical protein
MKVWQGSVSSMLTNAAYYLWHGLALMQIKQNIMCRVKEKWTLLTPDKLVANLMPYVLLCWTFLTWCCKNMSKNIKIYTTLNEKQKHYIFLQINVKMNLHFFVCVFSFQGVKCCVLCNKTQHKIGLSHSTVSTLPHSVTIHCLSLEFDNDYICSKLKWSCCNIPNVYPKM